MFLFLIPGLIIIGSLWLYADPRPITKRFSDGILRSYLILFIICSPQVFSYLYFPLPQSGFDPLIVGIGIIMFLGGMALDIWARLTMGKLWGPPGQHDRKRQIKLITNGPFKYSRNPIYLGTFILLTGLSLSLRSVFFWLPILHLFYFTGKIKKEEQLLQEVFGSKYKLYRSKTPMFI